MYSLKAEYRDKNIKAKKLRRNGMIPSCIYGINLDESILIQIPAADVGRFVKTNSRGSMLAIDLGDKKYNVLFKNIDTDIITNQVEHIEFQNLVATEAINSVAQIVLINKDKNQHLIQQHLEEIPYNALPAHLVERIVIDLDGLDVGTSITVGDLDIAKDTNVRLLIDTEILVMNIVSRSKLNVDEGDDEAEVEGDEEQQQED